MRQPVLSVVERSCCPEWREAEVLCDVLCHRARSFYPSKRPPLVFVIKLPETNAIALYLTRPLLPERVLLAAETSWMLDVLARPAGEFTLLADPWWQLNHAMPLSSWESPVTAATRALAMVVEGTANCWLGRAECGQTLQDFGSLTVFLVLPVENNLILGS